LSLGKLLVSIPTNSNAALKSGAEGVQVFFNEIDQGATDAFNDMHGYAKDYQSSMSGLVSEITGDWIEGIDTVTEADRKAHKAREKEAEGLAKIKEKINAEEKKQNQLEMTALEKLNATIKERVAIEKELEGIDPWSEDAAKKELDIAKLQTEELKLQAAAEEEAVEAKMNKLDLELQIAKASGDPNRIAAAQKELDTETQIVALMNQHKIGREEATRILGDQNAHLDKQKDLELQLLQAQADGNFQLAAQLQGRIDKEKEALAIMDEFGISIEEARVIAEKLAAINGGPDLNDSGFTTPREQREFERQQKERQKQQDEINEQELRDERERGRNIRNASDERRDTGTIAERMAASKEERERKAANRAINKEGNEAVRKQMIAAEDARRANVVKENAAKFGGGEPKKPMSNLERQKAKNEALKERRAAEEKAKNQQPGPDGKPKVGGPPLGPDGKPMDANGNHIGPDGKMVGPNGEPLGPGGGGGGGGPDAPGGPNAPGGGGGPDAPGGGGGPNAPGGGGGGGPKEPKKPENKIEKHLQC
jgi:hypothetical protein